MKRPSRTQLAALQHYADNPGEPGNAASESWAASYASDKFSWHRHERTLVSLERNGWVDGNGLTESGEACLRAAREVSRG